MHLVSGFGDHRQEGGRCTHVGDAVVTDLHPDCGWIDLTLTDVDSSGSRDSPGVTPAVAVKHGQRPQV